MLAARPHRFVDLYISINLISVHLKPHRPHTCRTATDTQSTRHCPGSTPDLCSIYGFHLIWVISDIFSRSVLTFPSIRACRLALCIRARLSCRSYVSTSILISFVLLSPSQLPAVSADLFLFFFALGRFN